MTQPPDIPFRAAAQPPALPPSGLASFDVDYPEEGLDRLTTFFRLFMVIPIAIVLGLLSGSGGNWDAEGNTTSYAFTTGGLIVAPAALMLIFRGKYPKWWFEFNRELSRFSARVGAYFGLLTDVYPSTDEQQRIHLELPDPATQQLGNLMPLVKWFFAIPHYIVLFFLFIGVWFATIIAWFAILFTGRYPRPLFDFVVGVSRWYLRVAAYAFLLVTDEYPPFRLAP